MTRHNQSKTKNMEKTTLADYYANLPATSQVSPKLDFLRQVSKECGVTINSVRNWILNGMKPANPEHIEIISRITKISSSELWEN